MKKQQNPGKEEYQKVYSPQKKKANLRKEIIATKMEKVKK